MVESVEMIEKCSDMLKSKQNKGKNFECNRNANATMATKTKGCTGQGRLQVNTDDNYC